MAHVTIPADGPFISYTGDGTTVAFAFPFPFFDAADITVYLDGVAQSGDYTVSGDALDGGFSDGTVTFDTAPASSVVVDMVRRLDVERVTDFPYPSQVLDIQSLNTELDRIVAMIQGVGLDSRRAVRVPEAEIGIDELPGYDDRASKVIGFDVTGRIPTMYAINPDGSVVSEDLILSVVNTVLGQIFPVGMIMMWAGSIASIPAGWVLCNGANGSPDLRNRFVVGAGSTYAVAATGGATSVSSGPGGSHNHAGSTGSHTLTTAEMPAHAHDLTYKQFQEGTAGIGRQFLMALSTGDNGDETGSEGGGGAHAHTIPTQADHTHTVATLPPYYALAYIMRTGSWSGTSGEWIVKPEVIQFACGDETTELDAGTGVITLRMPFAMTLQQVRASLNVASTSGAVTIDVNQGGTTVLSTKLTIDQGEKTSTTAATAAVISNTALADDAEITIDIDGAGADAAGLKVVLIGVRV